MPPAAQQQERSNAAGAQSYNPLHRPQAKTWQGGPGEGSGEKGPSYRQRAASRAGGAQGDDFGRGFQDRFAFTGLNLPDPSTSSNLRIKEKNYACFQWYDHRRARG